MDAVFVGESLTCVRGERIVFRALDFRVESGGALVLVGPNGCGKSSLLRLMAGLGRPCSGRMTWNDGVIDDPEHHRSRLRYLGHLDAIKPTLTVAENVAFWSALTGRPDGAPSNQLFTALAAFGLERLAHVPGGYLSAGQRRRVALARLLAAPVLLWLLDEPRSSLDADATTHLDAAIAQHRAEGGMLVMSLHGRGAPPGATVLDIAPYAARPGESDEC